MRRFITLSILVACVALSEQASNYTATRGPPDSYQYFPGIGYYKYVNHAETFENAEIFCEKDGSHLAIINSIDEAYALVLVYRQYYQPGYGWPTLGFNDFEEKGVFKTVLGDPIESTGYSYWWPGDAAPFDKNCGCLSIEGMIGTHCCDCGRTFICEYEIPQ